MGAFRGAPTTTDLGRQMMDEFRLDFRPASGKIGIILQYERLMKPKVTISISKESLDYLNHFIGKRGSSRSQVVESFIRESRQRRREEALARRAKQFFGQPEPE